MLYHFEFVDLGINGGNRSCKLNIWIINGVTKLLLFSCPIDIYSSPNQQYVNLYQKIKNDNCHDAKCVIQTKSNNFKTVITIDSYFINIIEYSNDERDYKFKLVLPCERCDKDSFIEFLQQLILFDAPNRPIKRDYEQCGVYYEYLKQMKKYDMYIPISKIFLID